jgi:hypothetical protein
VINLPAGTTEGYTLITTTPIGPLGSGPFFEIWPDAITLAVVNTPASVGNPLHFIPGFAGVYPDAPFTLPAGTLSFLAGQVWDVDVVALGSGFVYLGHTNAARLSW